MTNNTSLKKILVVDDDTTFLLMLKSFLEKKGFETETVSTAEKGLATLQKKSYDLILSDYRMPGMDGIEMLSTMHTEGIHTPLILLTSYGDIKLAVKAMKFGAADYLTKPVNPEELLELVKSVLKKPVEKPNENKPQSAALSSSLHSTGNTRMIAGKNDFVAGKSASTRKVNEYVELVGPTGMSVLIQGESGTGKEYVARQIHEHSKRKGQAFVAIDCGALSRELAASELFGHVKGSFTGANNDKPGQFEYANGGTLFLDEIGNLGYEIQVQLLRALQEKVVRRVGGREDIPVDVRLVAATNENLQDAIEEKDFREDLYHRLNEFKIEISPLRVRTEEIAQFAHHFLDQANTELEKEVNGFDEQTMEFLKAYAWPGNLRELKNVIKRSVLLTKGDTVLSEALPGEVIHYQHGEKNFKSLKDSKDLKQLEGALERQKIMEALEQVRYNKTKAAKLLNIDRKTLYNKIKVYDLKV
ncbi:MAG: sigma-54 dependent transcriptional regulator [Owenweeksia sp.]